jgi:F420-dependent methylenetetrahydromethanopterin dehydrogenase
VSTSPLAIINLNDFLGLLNFEYINLLRNIRMLNSVQYFLDKHFQEFIESRRLSIPKINFSHEELNEILKWFNPKTKLEEVKEYQMDLVIKISQINQEETDIPKFIRNMSLTYLVSNFEDYFAKCLFHYFQLDPRILLSSRNKGKGEQQKMITYDEILDSSDQKEIIESLIQKELEIIMRKDIDEIIQDFQNLLKIKINDANDFTEFKEVFYRRNSIIHHRGFTNPTYNKKNNLAKKTIEELITDHHYLKESFTRIIAYAEKIKTIYLEKIRINQQNSIS